MKDRRLKLGFFVMWVVGLIFVALPQAAEAHHPEVSGTSVCVDGVPVIKVHTEAWSVWPQDGSPVDGDRRVQHQVELTYASSTGFVRVVVGEFSAANGYAFDHTFTLPNVQPSVTVRSTPLVGWGPQEQYGGEGDYRETVISIPVDCVVPPIETIPTIPTTTIAGPTTTITGPTTTIETPTTTIPVTTTVTIPTTVTSTTVPVDTSTTIGVTTSSPPQPTTIEREQPSTSLTQTQTQTGTLPRTGTNVLELVGWALILMGIGGGIWWLTTRRTTSLPN